MGRKKDKGGGGIPEWMCTFGDMMSLLLCFFIMLYSMSIIAEIKWEALVETLRARLHYSGRSKVDSRSNKTTATISNVSERSRRTAALSGSQPTPGPGEFTQVQSIRPDADIVKGGLIRFELGSDELTDQAEKDLQVMLPILINSPNKIMVKGHVAPTEEGKRYERDIDLARARAIKVMDNLISLGLKQEFFQIGVVDSTAILNRAILPAGTDPKLTGASVEVFLLAQTPRPVKENIEEEQQATDILVPETPRP